MGFVVCFLSCVVCWVLGVVCYCLLVCVVPCCAMFVAWSLCIVGNVLFGGLVLCCWFGVALLFGGLL